MHKDIHAATKVPLIVPAIEEMLRELLKVNISEETVNLSVSTLNCVIKHKLPQLPRELQLYNMKWQTVLFLSALGPDTFLEIVYSIMLEKSVIFVSDNLALLSSAVLGIQYFL
jgi:DENN (AEX-3) domain